MSGKGKNEHCRICGGNLRGNQRRWLFAALTRRNAQPATPTESVSGGGSLSQSTQSSPWGSTLSLGSSGSLSRSQISLSSTNKSPDVLAVLTHILGQAVPRNSRTGEFVCGKCVAALERVFKFDTVIARVRVLSSERLQKLTQERDKIRQWVRQNYRQRHPQDFRNKSSTSEEEEEEEEDGEAEKEAYRQMLVDNMALSAYECWSEKWDTCPYFIRTGKRCRKGKGCEGCDSLRVSDSDYESVCGIPRHLPFQTFSPLELSRDKSRSMPLRWQELPSSSPASRTGSSLSLMAPSPLDTPDGRDPFRPPGDASVDFVLTELRGIEGKPVSSPSGSKIPVLGRKDRKSPRKVEGPSSPRVSRVLSFGDAENGGGEEDGDVPTELRDEYVPLQREKSNVRLQGAVGRLRAQLDQAATRIKTLEAELGRAGPTEPAEVNGSEEPDLPNWDDGGSSALHSLGHSLHSRERLIQVCLGLIRGLCDERGTGAELEKELAQTLKDVLSDNKAALQTLRSELADKEQNLEKEIDALRKAGRDREGDLDTLRTVLQSSQDVIQELRASLGEKDGLLKGADRERDLWRRKDGAVAALLQEKDGVILNLQQQLEVRQTGDQLAAFLKIAEENGAVTKLAAALQESHDLLQAQQQSHSQTVSSLTARLRDVQQQLREKEKERKEADRERRRNQEDGEREQRRLRASLQKRDRLIEHWAGPENLCSSPEEGPACSGLPEPFCRTSDWSPPCSNPSKRSPDHQILVDAEERDHLLQELQRNLQNKREPVSAVKHTL